ncbi:MAG: phytanoyl-CoA dioxygenase family protein [Acidiferrobacteraceae bacterium]
MLADDQKRRFQREGYLILPGFADAVTVAALRAAAKDELAQNTGFVEYESDVHYPGSPPTRESEGGRTARRLLRAFDRRLEFRTWAQSSSLAGAVSELLCAPPVLVQAHHNCVMTKQPRYSSETGWHQDIRYWSYERPDLVTAWLALTEERPDNGCLRLLPGSHRHELPREAFDERLFLRTEHPEARAWLGRETVAALAPGDLLLFHALTLHAAGRNLSDQPKLSLVFTYKGRDNKPVPGSRSAALPDVPLVV